MEKASMTHKQRVEKFNEHLDSLTEHFDIPKVSWTKWAVFLYEFICLYECRTTLLLLYYVSSSQLRKRIKHFVYSYL